MLENLAQGLRTHAAGSDEASGKVPLGARCTPGAQCSAPPGYNPWNRIESNEIMQMNRIQTQNTDQVVRIPGGVNTTCEGLELDNMVWTFTSQCEYRLKMSTLLSQSQRDSYSSNVPDMQSIPVSQSQAGVEESSISHPQRAPPGCASPAHVCTRCRRGRRAR